ncbi:probable RNA-dependent RNA polymerase 1 [Olea europaea var. sylvestris]|uniref:probable RNA-dependent RNA polymerase 1 n=1 Tax=Olea europaea var. sylvestris TaxID=158386 RepID=UPI000C1D6618|nr:probable RNA-dependent RNA polymerase 1 [Olea europaea var. sylvestris]
MGKTIQVSGFPSLVAAETVKTFLELYTGRGSVVALGVNLCKGSHGRAYARVQFETSTHADIIFNLAKADSLYYDASCLKAWADIDIMRNPRTYLHEMECVTLNFGSQISREKFSVLWKNTRVSVKFGIGLKKMYFFFSYNSVQYKLQLSYENIWRIVLYCPRGQISKLLLIQLVGAPRIYKKLNGSDYTFFKETPDDQWIRTTDFTPSCIGQSSGLCLQLSYGMNLPNFLDNFACYKKSVSQFSLETGSPFCHNSSLVPILHPPEVIELPWNILFTICTLVQHGCLPGQNLDAKFFRLVDPQRIDIGCIEYALEKLYNLKECCYDPVSWLKKQYHKYFKMGRIPKSPAIRLDYGLVYVRRVQVTPSKVYFSGPEVNVSNRVLRHYHKDINNFLRVSFVDEEEDKMYSSELSPKVASGIENRRTEIYERILSTLRNGIVIGDKKFDFLAFSSSQLKDNSAWMFASTATDNADDIRRWMGDFRSIRNVAKYAARLGQSFGSSIETLSVDKDEIELIPDIKAVRGGTFSDGIGKISAKFACRVAKKCGLKNSFPSAFQIRYGGYKGVVAVDPSSRWKLSLRRSMLKYDSDNTKLDVLAWSKYQPCFLNRQIISLLSTLGVKDHIFEKKQRDAVAQLDTVLVDPVRAEEALDLMSPGENTNILKEMLRCGYLPDGEPFLSMMLQTFRAAKLLDLRVKSRIFVPQARQMMGCLDETGSLEYGQVFIQFSGAGRRRFCVDFLKIYDNTSDDYNYIVKGMVVVAKNPCLHPGDVRRLEAVDVPALYHMVDCVVFPQKGQRPHPNECSGSDLDGDIYFVCWDPDLIPPEQCSPMDYTPAPSTKQDHDVTVEEVKEYFVNYMVNDSLGIIASAHTVFADKEPRKALSEPCIELAKLHSTAVDFPKTGVPAVIPPDFRVKEYPDFMEKPDKTTYESKRVIGKLFRDVKNIAPHTAPIQSFTLEVAMKSYDPDMEVDGFEDYIEEAFHCKAEYDFKLGNLMGYYGIKTEAEILSGGIMKTSRSFDRRRDADAIGTAVRSLRSEARKMFEGGSESDDMYAKASAWYHVTYHHEYWGCYNEGLNRDHYISFPWCVYDKLVQIKKSSLRRSLQMSSLERKFKLGMSFT